MQGAPFLSAPNLSASVDDAPTGSGISRSRSLLTQSLDPSILTPNTQRKNPNLLRVKEFGSLSPNSPNLHRRLDPETKAEVATKSNKAEQDEKHIRALEANSALAPSRGAPLGKGRLAWAFNPEKTVVSLPIKLAELREMAWFEAEERMLKEYDKVREVSLKLLFGPQEKVKRIGHGSMEEPVFTVGPFKDSRVKLSKRLGEGADEDSTYYNALWIGKEFIAAAMPQTGKAREAFWRLVWEYDVHTVVMLNEDIENSHRHSDIQRYLPNVLNEWERYGEEMEVLKAEQVTARNMSATVRKIRIRHSDNPGEVKDVMHLQYRDWPDGGIPSDRDDYKEFIAYLLSLSRTLREGGGGPVLVHCFGGKGRTGTTIAALLELQKVEQFQVDEIDICGTVSEMRTFRSMLVETVEQYKFIFWVVMAIIKASKNNVL